MVEVDFNPVVWVSLASPAGLSLISLGQPGLRSDLDEQVYTGGLTAVQQMLGGEVGGDTTRFIGGSHSNKTGRFLVKGANSELVGQFLLISQKDIQVAPALVDYYEQLVTIFAEETLETDAYRKVEQFFMSLTINEVLETFLMSIQKARKKSSIPTDEKLFLTSLSETLQKSINDYEYSATLVKISELKGKYDDLRESMKAEKKGMMVDLEKDIFEFLASEFPHALVMYPKIGAIEKTLSKSLNNEMKNLKTEKALEELIGDFEEKDLHKFLEDYSLHEVTKANLHSQLEDEIFHKFLRDYPILYLADPEINGFKSSIEQLTVKINEEHDLGGTLSRIGTALIGGNEEVEEKILLPYIRHYCEQFSAGLTPAAWKYMQVLFKLVTMETKVDVIDVLPSFKDQIPEAHFKTIEKMITKYKLTKLAPLSFPIKTASDALPFYRALFSSLGYGINTVITEVALGKNGSRNLFNQIISNMNEFCTRIHQAYAIFSIFLFLEMKRSRLDFTLTFPGDTYFNSNQDTNLINPKTLIDIFTRSNVDYLKKEQQSVEQILENFTNAIDAKIQDINKFLDRKPSEISGGYSIDIKETKLLSLPLGPMKSVDEILQKTIEEYLKLYNQVSPQLDKAKEAAQKVLEGKMDENKFKGFISNRGYLEKLHENVRKMIRKTKEDIAKKYREAPSTIEKQLNGFLKDLNKEYNQACTFLNINRKALSKGENFLPDPTNTLPKLYSSIDQIYSKERILTKENLGKYYFYAKNRSLPPHLESEISSSLVQKKSYPLLKEAIEHLKKNPTSNIFRSYALILEDHAKELIGSIFRGIGTTLSKSYLRSNADIFFVEVDKIPVPTLELGVLPSADVANSFRNFLGPNVVIEAEKSGNGDVFRALARVPDFGCRFKKIKKVWATKDWNLTKVLLTLSWYSLLNSHDFYISLLRYSADLYSVRVKDSFEEILDMIRKNILKN